MKGILSLDCLPCGRVARVLDVDANHAAGERFLALGLLPGGEVTVDRVAPLGDPIAIRVGSLRLAIRRRDAACIRLTFEKRDEP